MEMLRSINKSTYSQTTSISHQQMTPGKLHRHEFDDNSPDEESNPFLRHCRSAGLKLTEDSTTNEKRLGDKRDSRKIRSTRNEMMKLLVSFHDSIAKPFREKRGDRTKRSYSSLSTAKAQPSRMTQEQLQKLIYDSDFDCYYDPVHERYYKITPI
ncbi:hypothetical protein PMAYCL1PPCAC_18222 [Pristionchus mayeri]|uniref:Uncharacterized protein n=1 Tax=Pristionchus mayeri TaxID=1317129 RepID=A0AAN5I133_9BILA|nr:hypothetical protein PMAYCL1PPCAC_18222 [Pristionchus mayeri]